ncbi:hypothetical protein IM538_09055 [Cytobacillus suaedae]|nr:hypothetical protein IM538_09055 [Cytobacillus suaedae]
MKTFLKWVIGILAVVTLIMGIFIFLFFQSMKPDQKEVEKVQQQAEEYIVNTFKDEVIIFDTLFDNMGNFPYFEYAANAENKQDGTQFLVFFNKATNQMEDTYIADKWERELEREIRPYLERTLGTLDELWIFYPERTGIELNVDPNQPSSYKDYDAKPHVMIFIPRKADTEDKELFEGIVGYLKNEAEVKHGSVSLEYIDRGVHLEEKVWHEEF